MLQLAKEKFLFERQIAHFYVINNFLFQNMIKMQIVIDIHHG